LAGGQAVDPKMPSMFRRYGLKPKGKEVNESAYGRTYLQKDYLMERKFGTVYASNPKGWIFIYVTPQDRYFGHVSQITSDRLPAVGDRVSFEPSASVVAGKLPCALDVRPVEISSEVKL
jgi:hypothetical protein